MRERIVEPFKALVSWRPQWAYTRPDEMASRLRTIQIILGALVLYYLVEAHVMGYKLAQYVHSIALVGWVFIEVVRVRYKKIKFASWFGVIMTIFVLCGTTMLDGQSDSWIPWLFPVVPLMAGQLLGNRAMISTGLIVSITAFLVTYSDHWVVIPREYPVSWMDTIVLRLAALALCCGASIDSKRTSALQVNSLAEQANDLERVREERDEARRSASVFLSSMSGHIREPMAKLVVNADRIRAMSKGEAQDLALDASSCARQLDRLVNDILDLSDLENDRLTLRPLSFRLHVFADSVRSWFDTQGARGISLELKVPEDDLEILIDERRLWQIFERLLDNAIKFSQGQRVEVTIEVRRLNDSENSLTQGDCTHELLVSICDDGVGIPESLHAQVMQRFAFYSDSQANLDRGAGVSLVLIRQLVAAMNGTISFEQRKNCSGTSVKLRFLTRAKLSSVSQAA